MDPPYDPPGLKVPTSIASSAPIGLGMGIPASSPSSSSMLQPPPSTLSGSSPGSSRTKRLDRRIPRDQRRRAAASCDNCKLKRNKCSRDSGDDNSPCNACRAAGIPCKYTIPRKRRVSSDVPGKRKYEYVDAAFYTSEPDDSPYRVLGRIMTPEMRHPQDPSSSTSGPPSTGSHKAVTPSQTPSTVGSHTPGDTHLAPLQTSSSLPSTLTSSLTSFHFPPSGPSGPNLGGVSSHPLLPPPGPGPGPPPGQGPGAISGGSVPGPSGSSSAVSGSSLGPSRASSFTGIAQFGLQAETYTSGGPVGPFSEKLHHFGVLGSFSLMVQVRALFANVLKGSNHQMLPPQTMGSETIRPITFPVDSLPAFPDRHLADTLVDTYFNTVHGDYPIFHKSTFFSAYQRLLESGPTSYSPSWLVCVYMALTFGLEEAPAHLMKDSDREDLKARYVAACRGLILETISGGSSLLDVQALLMFGYYLFFDGQRDFAWNIVGTAIRVALAIGLNSGDGGFRLNPIESENRRRVWWTLYRFERLESASLGRPSAIDDYDCAVEYPRPGILDNDPQALYDIRRAQNGLYSIFGALFKRFSAMDMSSSEALAVASEFYERLSQWYHQLPEILTDINQPPLPPGAPKLMLDLVTRARYSLLAEYHHIVSFMCRSFLGQLATAGRPQLAPYDETFLRRLAGLCTSSSLQVFGLMQRVDADGLFRHRTGMDIYWIHFAALGVGLQSVVDVQFGEQANLNSIRDQTSTMEIVLEKYPNPSRTMARYGQVVLEVVALIREASEKVLQQTWDQYHL